MFEAVTFGGVLIISQDFKSHRSRKSFFNLDLQA
jgi:hypothetical protein